VRTSAWFFVCFNIGRLTCIALLPIALQCSGLLYYIYNIIYISYSVPFNFILIHFAFNRRWSCVFNPGNLVLRFPVTWIPPMRFGSVFSSPVFSTPAIWSHVFQSRVFSVPDFSSVLRCFYDMYFIFCTFGIFCVCVCVCVWTDSPMTRSDQSFRRHSPAAHRCSYVIKSLTESVVSRPKTPI